MSKTKKTVGLVIAIVVIVGLVWWVIGKKGNRGGDVITIGWIGPLTGDAAAYGEAAQNVTNLAVDEINAAGGVDGKKVSIIYEDGACGGGAASAMQKLVNIDRVQAVLGGFCSAESLAAVPIATRGKVMMISISSSPKLTNASQYFVRDYPSDNSEGNILADAAWNTKHWKTVAFLQEQTDYPAGIYGAFTERFKGLGGRTINEQYVANTSDFRSLLLKLKSQNPEALFIDSNGSADAPRILQQMKNLGWNPPLLIIDSIANDAKTVQENASALEGALTAQFSPDQSNPKLQGFLVAYKTRYGIELPFQNYGETEYDIVRLLVDGIRIAGNNGPALATWLHAVKDWQGVSGTITIDSNGDRVGGDTLQVIHNGVPQPVR